MVGKRLRKPAEAILETKKKKNMGKTIGYLVLSAVLLAIAAAIASAKTGLLLGMIETGPLVLAVGMFLLVVVGAFVVGWIVTLIATILGGKGDQYEGLTSVTNALFVPSIGALVAVLVSFVPYVGLPLIFLVLAISISIGLASLYRSVKELFSTDMITAFVVVSVLSLALILALFATMISLSAMVPFSKFALA
ncbi:MAG: YIP1 family protein [Candidatus Aenigmatarchaeota archaeon]